MGKRGPTPEPTKLKILKGNPGRRPLNTAEPDPPLATPDPPDFLDDIGLREWYRVMPEIEVMELNCLIDATMLGVYCRNVSVAIRADERVGDDGMVVYVGEHQYPTPNPYLTIANKAWAEALKFAKEFGFTPASRSSLKVERQKPKGEDEEEDRNFFRQAKTG